MQFGHWASASLGSTLRLRWEAYFPFEQPSGAVAVAVAFASGTSFVAAVAFAVFEVALVEHTWGFAA